MTDPVDLTHLRELTGGDEEIEKSLFDLFISSSDECIKVLEDNCSEGENIEWQKQAHAFKGSAINIGAQTLSDVCVKAQETFDSSVNDKAMVLETIKSEYEKAKKFLQGLH